MDFAPWGAKSDARYPYGQGYSAAVMGKRWERLSYLLPQLSEAETELFSARQNVEFFGSNIGLIILPVASLVMQSAELASKMALLLIPSIEVTAKVTSLFPVFAVMGLARTGHDGK